MSRRTRAAARSATVSADGRLAIAYYRCSDPRQDLSVDRQEGEIRAAAERDGFAIVRTFKDDGISAWSGKERPGFNGMMRFVKERAGELGVTRLYCYKQSRLGRTMRRVAETLHTVEVVHGVEVRATAEATPEDAKTRKIMRAITSLFDEIYCDDLSEVVISGMKAQAERGYWLYGHIPFGYAGVKLDPARPAKLARDPVAALVVERIVQLRLVQRLGYRKIAELLTSEREPPPSRADIPSSNEAWEAKHVKRIMANRVYTGAIVYDGEVAMEKAHAALMSVEDQEADALLCRTRTREKITRTDPVGGGERGVLTPWLRCGACGGRVCVRQGGAPTKRSYSYGCTNHHGNRETCGGFSVRVDVLDPVVLPKIGDDVLTPPDAVASLIEATCAHLHRTPDEALITRRAALIEEERDLNVKIKRNMASAEEVDDASDYNARIRALQATRARVRDDLAALPEPGPIPDAGTVNVEAFRAAMQAAWNGAGLKEQRKALANIVSEIAVDPAGVVTIKYAWHPDTGVYGVQSPYGPPSGACARNGGWWKCERVGRPRERRSAT